MLRYSIFTKFLIIVLCAVSLVACAAGAGCILVNESTGLYTHDLEEWLNNELDQMALNIAHSAATLYAAEYRGECTRDMLNALEENWYPYSTGNGDWSVSIYQGDELLLEGPAMEGTRIITYQIAPHYPSVHLDSKTDKYLYQDIIWARNTYTGENYEVYVAYYEGPVYRVAVTLLPTALNQFRVDFTTTAFSLRYHAITALVVGLLIFAASLVYLCCAAGRRPHVAEAYPVALNRLPLDLYLAMAAVAECGLGYAAYEMLTACFDHGGNWAVAALICLTVFAMAVLVVAFLFAVAAQMKTKGGFWWRRSVIGWCLIRFFRCIRLCVRGIGAVCNLLPLVWQWLGFLLLMLLVPFGFFCFTCMAWDGFWEFFWGFLFFISLAGDLFLFGWWIWYMGVIVRGVAMMRRGDLDHKIPTTHMRGRFRDFAVSLNSMADAARIAAERQLKSERMKTELITNVSHDIKTPLTSIINYVDLLKKPHDEAQGQQYLDVLDRQSQRLKKLIGDLMDMSKASTGNMAVELERMDAVEAVNQALGEFSDKLAAVGLEPLFRCPRETVMIRADGRLLWRVLSNLLSNAVKYAMPGTRLYLDLMTVQGNAVLNLKNISRDQLNVDAEELMERFVRGDASRNTEGSGLGLNIAKSLVELQKGQMHLMVDGDLFKVTIVLPLCEE